MRRRRRGRRRRGIWEEEEEEEKKRKRQKNKKANSEQPDKSFVQFWNWSLAGLVINCQLVLLFLF